MKSLTFGVAFMVIGLLLVASTGYGEVQNDNVLQEAINAVVDYKNPFHYVALLGFALSGVGSICLIFWMLFGGSNKRPEKTDA